MQKRVMKGAILLVVATVVALVTGSSFRNMQQRDIIIPGPAVIAQRMLSDYFPRLQHTAGDTPVFIIEGEEEGGTFLALGGTHADEIAGVLAAVLLVEQAEMEAGRLIVIPNANNSASSHTLPVEASPQRVAFTLPSGTERTFRYGSRISNPLHQWPDPEVYVHRASGQLLAGDEVRNLNRAHPGRANGNITEKIAYGIRQLILEEEVDILLDMHEASPEYPVVDALVSHQNAMSVGSNAILNMQIDGWGLQLEVSPKNLRGLSHRELGDYTPVLALLSETPNPSQGRLRGATNEHLVLTGQDEAYKRAGELGYLYVPFGERGHPIEERVGKHLLLVQELIDAFHNEYTDKPLQIRNVPSVEQLLENGYAYYLREPDEDNN